MLADGEPEIRLDKCLEGTPAKRRGFYSQYNCYNPQCNTQTIYIHMQHRLAMPIPYRTKITHIEHVPFVSRMLRTSIKSNRKNNLQIELNYVFISLLQVIFDKCYLVSAFKSIEFGFALYTLYICTVRL